MYIVTIEIIYRQDRIMSSLRHVQRQTTQLNAWALKHLEYIRPELVLVMMYVLPRAAADQDQPSADHMEQYSSVIQLWHSGTSKKYGVYIIRIKYDGILSALGYTVVSTVH